MRKQQARALGLIIAAGTLVASAPVMAQGADSATLKQLQEQIQMLQQQVQTLQQQQARNTNSPYPDNAGTESTALQNAAGDVGVEENPGAETQTAEIGDEENQTEQVASQDGVDDRESKKDIEKAEKGPVKKLAVGGAVAANYQVRGDDVPNQRDGGNLNFNYFAVNFSGQYGKLTYAAEQRFSEVNFGDSSYLHYGWGAYDFNDHHQLKVGYFQRPFGNIPIGYQSFWGNLGFYTGFNDNQAGGAGYRYTNGPWQVDVDFFKNATLNQPSTYGANPVDGYDQVNGGNGRLGYTFNQGGDKSVNVSLSARGGELEVGDGAPGEGTTSDYGSHWAVAAATHAVLNDWTLDGQFTTYKYNVPDGRTAGGNDLPTDSVTIQNYGFRYQIPAEGNLYTADIGHSFTVDRWTFNNFNVYAEYGYLDVGTSDGTYSSGLPVNGNMGETGNVQLATVGAYANAGPFYVWADMIYGRNAAMAFTGPNDGDWHPRFNLALAYYFSADVID
ncbi:hypothetical protein [Salinisphaera japonica]|uniref:Porin n=1 Tax=Salinisphaera japonica YTM-1 TaxID=1209778 RepID=A0A423PZ04_9GAMM|nr:hypothetical protein [Salinisphaera japonica]ROO30770.1 hypothetical protein SAJA_04330 [Salinisphaera japonica YTM-1]